MQLKCYVRPEEKVKHKTEKNGASNLNALIVWAIKREVGKIFLNRLMDLYSYFYHKKIINRVAFALKLKFKFQHCTLPLVLNQSSI